MRVKIVYIFSTHRLVSLYIGLNYSIKRSKTQGFGHNYFMQIFNEKTCLCKNKINHSIVSTLKVMLKQ